MVTAIVVKLCGVAGDEALAASEMGTDQTASVANVTPTVDVADPVLPVASDAVATEPAVSDAAATAPDVVAATSAALSTEASAAEATLAPAETVATEPGKAPQLKMSFTADCWLDVKDANGKTLFSGLKKANDELVLEGPEPLRFIIGAPMAVNLEYQGKSFDMSRYNNGRTARFSLPQE